MTTEQILWGVNTFLLACVVSLVALLYHTLRGDIKEVKEEIAKRTLIVNCDKVHLEIKKDLHTHAKTGSAGEVVGR